MLKRNHALAPLLCIALCACVTSGGTQTINDFSRFQQLHPGETTKAQLYTIFGQPHAVSAVAGGGSAWTYYQVVSRINASTYVPFVGLATGGDDVDVTIANFTFDQNNVLVGSDRQQETKYVNMWAGAVHELTAADQAATVEVEMRNLNLPFDPRAARAAASWAHRAQH